MFYRLTICLTIVCFFACANEEKKVTATSYIGVTVPDFKNAKIDSLVLLYEADRALFYEAQSKGDMQSYYKQKMSSKDSYNVTGFYDDVIKILNSDSDKEEIQKFQAYIKESTTKAKTYLSKLQK